MNVTVGADPQTAPSQDAPPLRWIGASVLLLGLLWAPFAWVRPTNFGGTDDWVVINLASRGITDFPYANRPLNLIWTLPALFLMPDDLRGFWVLHGLYLSSCGLIIFAIGRRLLPHQPVLAFLWAAFTVVWAPRDHARLSSVTTTVYAGVMFGTLLALLLFLESLHGHRSALLALALAIVVGVGTARSHETALPLLVGAPLFLVPFRTVGLRRSLLSLAIWEAGMLLALAWALLPILRPAGNVSYQLSDGTGASFLVIAARLARQFGLHLFPLFTSGLHELLLLPVALAAGLFSVGVVLGGGGTRSQEPLDRRLLGRGASIGLLLGGLGYSALVLSGTAATKAATRMQFLSAPGIALFLACVVLLAASVIPAPRRLWVMTLLGAWVVAVGTGRLLAMQRERGVWTSYPVQQQCLVQLTQQAPHVKRNTLIVLVDDAGAWRASFTFHHAVQYLYEGRARGYVWQAQELLYSARFVEDGVWHEPWPVIRQAWNEWPNLYRYDEVVVMRFALGRLTVLESWPQGILPALPSGATYDPSARVDRSAPIPAARRILQRKWSD